MHESQTSLWMSKWLNLISQENGFPENLFNWSKVVHLGVYEAVHANTAGSDSVGWGGHGNFGD